MTRINLNDSINDSIVKMCEGNPGAMNVLLDMSMKLGMEGLHFILLLDSYGIYGSSIYVLQNDICDRKLEKTVAVLKAAQQGIIDEKILKDACSRQDRTGKDMIDWPAIYKSGLLTEE